MVWTLLLAHFLGDFPLQTDWIALNKKNFWVLSLHVGTHFVVMVLLVGQIRLLIWPLLLLLTLVHMGQDRLKIFLTDLWPDQRVLFYFLDQFSHYLAIWGLSLWVQRLYPNFAILQKPAWAIVSIAYLVVTSVWYISERVIYLLDEEHQNNITETKISRMLVRSGLLSLFFVLRSWLPVNLAMLLSWPYPASIYRKQAVLADIGVSLMAIFFLIITLGL